MRHGRSTCLIEELREVCNVVLVERVAGDGGNEKS